MTCSTPLPRNTAMPVSEACCPTRCLARARFRRAEWRVAVFLTRPAEAFSYSNVLITRSSCREAGTTSVRRPPSADDTASKRRQIWSSWNDDDSIFEYGLYLCSVCASARLGWVSEALPTRGWPATGLHIGHPRRNPEGFSSHVARSCGVHGRISLNRHGFLCYSLQKLAQSPAAMPQSQTRSVLHTAELRKGEKLLLRSSLGTGMRTEDEWRFSWCVIVTVWIVYGAVMVAGIIVALTGVGGVTLPQTPLFSTTWISMHAAGALVFAVAALMALVAGHATGNGSGPALAAVKRRASYTLAALLLVIGLHDIVMALGIANVKRDAFNVLDVPIR